MGKGDKNLNLADFWELITFTNDEQISRPGLCGIPVFRDYQTQQLAA
jgi:hypothetical protein